MQVLRCIECKSEYKLEKYSYCPNCGGILNVYFSTEYLLENIKKIEYKGRLWDFKAILPNIKEKNIISFNEGGTKLIKSTSLCHKLGVDSIYFKDETRNPTGSFKDRAITECVSMAKELNCRGIVVASSGNGGAATALYGPKAGLNTIVFVPESTPIGKVAQSIFYDADIIKVRGNFSNCYKAAKEFAEKNNYLNVTTTFMSPYGIEGYKTMAYEIYYDLMKMPDYVFIPVGAGPILYGIWKGFDEIRRGLKETKIPKLVCAQAAGCAPIVKGWKDNKKVVACHMPKTKASAISDPLLGYEKDGDATIKAIRDSNGYAVAIADMDLVNDGKMIAKEEGIFVEISSAAAFSALKILKGKNIVKKDDICVCLMTGSGLKDPVSYIPENYIVKVIDTIADMD